MKTCSRLACTGVNSCTATPGGQRHVAHPAASAPVTRSARRPRRPTPAAPADSSAAASSPGDGVRTSTVASVLDAMKSADRGVGDEPSAADHHEIGGGQRHLAHEVAGHEHGSALGGQPLEEGADPEDALGVETVDRFVEEQHPGVAQERGGDPQPLAHPEGELAGPPPRTVLETHHPEHLVDTRVRGIELVWATASRWLKAVRPGWMALASSRAPTSRRGHRSSWKRRPPMVTPPGVGPVEAHHHPHGRRLPRAVRAEEPGHHARAHLEGEVVDRAGGAVRLGQAFRRDHGRSRWRGMRRRYQERPPPQVRQSPAGGGRRCSLTGCAASHGGGQEARNPGRTPAASYGPQFGERTEDQENRRSETKRFAPAAVRRGRTSPAAAGPGRLGT